MQTQELIKNQCLATNYLDSVLSNEQTTMLKLNFYDLNSLSFIMDYFEGKKPIRSNLQIFLNADILKGPGNSPLIPLNAKAFLKECDRLDSAVLSLGWTTSWSFFGKIKYEEYHINEMLSLVRELAKEKKVTFAIRASLALRSWDQILKLLSESPQTSITLWSGLEGIPENDLNKIIKLIDQEERVYVDCAQGPRVGYYHPERLITDYACWN